MQHISKTTGQLAVGEVTFPPLNFLLFSVLILFFLASGGKENLPLQVISHRISLTGVKVQRGINFYSSI